jgi:hypothetical protein
MQMHGTKRLWKGSGGGCGWLGSLRAPLHAAWLALAVLGWAGGARADEPVKAGEPRMFTEPGEVTDVVDAFDGDDLFDLHLTLGYQYTAKSANVRRETFIGGATNPTLTAGGFVASNMNVASYSESTSRLNTKAEIGIYHDIALILRMPIILSNSRSLDDLSGSINQQATVLAGAPGEQLFSLPFKSPKRSGIEYLAAGIDFGIFNQMRDPTKPTWIIGFEGRFSLSEPMHACNGGTRPAGQVECAHFADYNRNGTADPPPDPTRPENNPETSFPNGDRGAGVSRGTTGLELHTMFSKRIKYIEPFAGFRTLFEFPTDKSDFGATDLKGSLVNHPPLQGWLIVGMQIIPWEQRSNFQRVTFEGRVSTSYRSEGRDYSELFDALGSSAAPSIRRPSYGSYMDSGMKDMNGQTISVVDPHSQRVYFTGISDVSQFATVQASAGITWQAGEYIKFQAGGGYTHQQAHIVTLDQPCNPDFKSDGIGAAGPCHALPGQGGITATGIPNPNYRPTIDSVGHRFKVEDTNIWDAWVNGIVMF